MSQALPHVSKAWKDSSIQALREDRQVSGAPSASELSSRAGDSDGDSSSTASSSSEGASYNHYSYLCAPPEGVYVDLENGIELER